MSNKQTEYIQFNLRILLLIVVISFLTYIIYQIIEANIQAYIGIKSDELIRKKLQL